MCMCIHTHTHLVVFTRNTVSLSSCSCLCLHLHTHTHTNKHTHTHTQQVGIDHTPVNAIGVLCQPRVVTPGKRFVLNLWFTQTHAREMDLIVVALNGDTKEYYGGFQVGVKEQQVCRCVCVCVC